MAEMAVSFARERLLPLLKEEAKLLGGMNKEFAEIKEELESIQAFIKDADRRASIEGDDTIDGIQAWVRQLRAAAFRIEDIIDEYKIYVGEDPCHLGCEALLCEIANLIATLIPRQRIASEIQDIKLCVQRINERRKTYNFQKQPPLEQGSSSSQNDKWDDPRVASLFLEEADVVGIDGPRDKLIGWLVGGKTERVVVTVVGLGGVGKTTLAKKVFDNQKVTAYFECCAWITVSQTYTVEGLLRNMLEQFCKGRNISTMDRQSLIKEVREYLQSKRYAVFFDDVWDENFWSKIEFSVLDNKIGSRIFITTRKMEVAKFCKKSSFIEVHELQPWPMEKSWKLFCMKAFQFEPNGCCPDELKHISFRIVKKCEGLPLAIVSIAGLLSTKEKNESEWTIFGKSLSLELENNTHLTSIKRILAFSYDDLPHYLKPCFLYFGMYPEDYCVATVRLIEQWIAEGFVKEEKGKTLEEVAKQYLGELICRSLVQVSEVDNEGKVQRCRVHDLIRQMIVGKVKDLSFCYFINTDDDNGLYLGEIVRRLAFATASENVASRVESSLVRSLHIFGCDGFDLHASFVKFRLLKVLNLQYMSLDYVPDNLGNLLHLRYLSLYNTWVRSLPKSIGKLQNLETLDLGKTYVYELPREISNLRKLRHLAFFDQSSGDLIYLRITGCTIRDGIGSLTYLQTLYFVDARKEGVKLIAELGKLSQLRYLGLTGVRREHERALYASIDKLHKLETLEIYGVPGLEILRGSFNFISLPLGLQKLRLAVKLNKLPDCIRNLRNLVELTLSFSELTDDPLESLEKMPNLLSLSISNNAYRGECLHFKEGFQKLKFLRLFNLSSLISIIIDQGALPTLKRLELWHNLNLKKTPSGILDLAKLETLDIFPKII